MPYTIGCRMHTHKNKNVIDGIYTFSTYGFPFILGDQLVRDYNALDDEQIKDVTYHMYYCHTAQDAEKLCQRLIKTYHNEFKKSATAQGDKDMSAFAFYPIKINSPKLPVRYDRKTIKRTRNSDNTYLCEMRRKKK